MRNLYLLLAIFVAGLASAAPPAEGPKPAAASLEETIKPLLPDATPGFEWVVYRNCAFLKPKGWNQRSLPDVPEKKIVGAIAVSPEQFSETKQFETGFTTQLVANFKKLNGIEPSKGAVLLIKPIADQRKPADILKFDSKPSQLGGTMFIFRYRDAPAGQTPLIVHKYMVANNEKDTLHIFTFESPESSWEDNWKKFGTPILEKIAIIPFLPASP